MRPSAVAPTDGAALLARRAVGITADAPEIKQGIFCLIWAYLVLSDMLNVGIIPIKLHGLSVHPNYGCGNFDRQ
jgi:hypothetical protein